MKIICIFALLSLVLLIGCDEGERKETYCTVTDILQVSSGGFGSVSRCILETTCGKLNIHNDGACSTQIGEQVTKVCYGESCWFD